MLSKSHGFINPRGVLRDLDIGGEEIIFHTPFNLYHVSLMLLALDSSSLTSSMEACNQLLASRPAHTLIMEKSPPRMIDAPPEVPSCRNIGSALESSQR
jgi:hypothetical protein